ncbi:MAG: IPT/TIG domain-containing protein [Bacteroidetes bacterium]|nr:IPT/TIG domain-containing protein [Bacteroidota bacterium]
MISSCKKDDSDSDDCPNCPSVTAISPAQAHAYENLTITGINFSSDPQSNIIKINGVLVDADSIVSGNQNQIIVKVPKGCGSGAVTVDLDAELTHFGTSPLFTYIYRYTVVEIGDVHSVPPCGSTPDCFTMNYIEPRGIALDASENVYFSDFGLNCIFKLDKNDGYSPCMLAGCAFSPGNSNGTGTNASFNDPSFIYVDNSNSIFVAENGSAIRTINPVGNVSNWFSSNDLNPVNGGIAFTRDNSGTAYVTNPGLYNISKIIRIGSGFAISHFAGATGVPGNADGQDSSATFLSPNGIATDASGNVYITDSENNLIRKITPSGVVTTFAGSLTPGFTNGQGTSSAFNDPQGIFIDSKSDIYIADKNNGAIRKITPAGLVSTAYQFTIGTLEPHGVTKDSQGNFYVTYRSFAGNGIKKIIVE